MRQSLGTGVLIASMLVLAVAAPSAWGATEIENLRNDLRETQTQLQQLLELQQQTQRRMEELQRKLDAIETRTPPTAPAAAAPSTPPPATAAQAAPPSRGLPSAAELARPREPFALYQQRGPGQLLFDMGIAGDFVGDFTSKRVEERQAGTFTGFENRVFPREVEVGFFGQIDPYARGTVIVEAAEELEADGSRTLNLSLAEAHLTLQTLPFGTQAKFGRVRNRFGATNEVHEHDLPQIDRPNVMRRFLGDEGLNETGGELSWVAPLPFYLEALAGVFNGDNDVIAGFGRFRAPLVTARVRSFVETDRFGALQFGVSGATGETPEERRTWLAGLDAKYKYTPAGWRHAVFTLAGEALYFNRRAETDEGDTRVRERYGWYTYAEVRPWTRWAGGLRFDWTQYPDTPGHEWALQPYLSFMPSEFLRFRLGYKYTDYSEGTAVGKTTASEVLLQGSFILGAHPAHPF
jgi:hypothetical protein